MMGLAKCYPAVGLILLESAMLWAQDTNYRPEDQQIPTPACLTVSAN